MGMTDITGKKPRIVVIGGGTGLSVLLRGLKNYPLDITAIVTVADDGGSSGRLRSEMQMPPPGDIRNVIVAMADTEPLLRDLLQFRFANGGLAGHSMGNLLLAALMELTGDFVSAVRELSRVLAVNGNVYPAANQAIVLHAEMTDGTVVSGESQIPKSGKKIKRVFLEPHDIKPLDEAVYAINCADMILIGPGSLYTSILPNLLVPGIVDAIRHSQAKKVYICNVMTQPGETDGYTVGDHVQAILDHVGTSLFSSLIVNNGNIPLTVQQQYAGKGASAVSLDGERLQALGFTNIIADDFVQYETYLRHDAAKVSRVIMKLIEEK